MISPAVTSSPSPSPSAPSTRLAWLDALRGIGALAVVAEHMLAWLLPELRPFWFNLGLYGVFVFFLISGYIIPASLEHHGDVRAFWISRIFRLYPLYLLVIALVLLMTFWVPVRPEVPRHPSAVAAHATMLLDVVHTGALADPMWTLSYEMVFYLLVTALFVGGVHRRSGMLAVVFGLVAVVAGLTMSAPLLPGPWPALVACAVFTIGLACVISGRFRASGAYALGGMATVLVIFGSFVPWFGAAIIAVMFTGTAVHRWQCGSGGLAPVACSAGLVALAPVWSIQAGWWWVQPQVWITTMALAGATFALGMALRARSMPRALVWLGLISYSVYLLHMPLIRFLTAVAGDPGRWSAVARASTAVGYLALVLSLSWLIYRLVEAPAQRLGKRIRNLPLTARNPRPTVQTCQDIPSQA